MARWLAGAPRGLEILAAQGGKGLEKPLKSRGAQGRALFAHRRGAKTVSKALRGQLAGRLGGGREARQPHQDLGPRGAFGHV